MIEIMEAAPITKTGAGEYRYAAASEESWKRGSH